MTGMQLRTSFNWVLSCAVGADRQRPKRGAPPPERYQGRNPEAHGVSCSAELGGDAANRRYSACVRGDGVRYQGALVRQGTLLLIEYQERTGRTFWLFPGGGRESETAEECVAREMREETGLRVAVGRRMLDGTSSAVFGANVRQ